MLNRYVPSTAASEAVCHALKPVGGLALLSTLFEVQPGGFAFLYQFLHNWKHLCLKVERCLQASWKTILQRMLLCFTLLVFYQMVSFDPPPHYTEFLSLIKFDAILFLGPRGPLVLPSVGPSVPSVPSARKIWITYIQAYMPYESWKDSSNQPYGPMGSLGCPLDPLGPPATPQSTPSDP